MQKIIYKKYVTSIFKTIILLTFLNEKSIASDLGKFVFRLSL